LYAEGRYSPRYGDEAQAMPGIELLDEAEDRQKLGKMRTKGSHGTKSLSVRAACVMLFFY
jgi:hypothetical protein